MKGVRAYTITNMLRDKPQNLTNATKSPLDPNATIPSGSSMHTMFANGRLLSQNIFTNMLPKHA